MGVDSGVQFISDFRCFGGRMLPGLFCIQAMIGLPALRSAARYLASS
jgi:hypothetical protein